MLLPGADDGGASEVEGGDGGASEAGICDDGGASEVGGGCGRRDGGTGAFRGTIIVHTQVPDKMDNLGQYVRSILLVEMARQLCCPAWLWNGFVDIYIIELPWPYMTL